MHRKIVGNYLLLLSAIVLTYVVITHKLETSINLTKYKNITKVDTFKIDTAAISSIKKLKDVDSIIKQDRQKERELLLERKHISDSIELVNKQLLELKRNLEKEKRQLKEKYEKHIENIYQSNCIQRGGPEDTLYTDR